MRLADEITEPRAPRPLPAPTGPRVPTGQVPVTLPTTEEPVPASDLPTLPRLAPVAPKPATGPHTGQVPTTSALTLEAFLAGNAAGAGTGRPTPPPEKRSHKVLIAFGGLIVVTLLLGAIFRNSSLGQRFTGRGYDTNPLPVHPIPRLEFAGAEYTYTTQMISKSNGLQTNTWATERDLVDFESQTAKLTIDRAEASVIGGTIGTPKSVSPPTDIIVDDTSYYEPGTAQTDPWIRHPHDPGWSMLSTFSYNRVRMYQDIVDPPLRAQEPTSVIAETRHDTPVTTYSYEFAFGDFYESAPRLFDLVQVMDGNAGTDAEVKVTISFDEQWVVRYLDVNVDFEAVYKYKAERDAEANYPYRYTFDVVSIMDKAPDISVPKNAVDPPPMTVPTTVVP